MQSEIKILAYEKLKILINENKRVACFSKSNNSSLMWSHYADGHRGFCLEFDCKYPPFNQAKDMVYLKNFIKIKLEEILLERINLEEYLNIKTDKWNYEEEMRIIYESDKLEYDELALNGMYFGLNMPADHKNIIAAIIRNNKFPTFLFDTSFLANKLGFSYRPVTFNYVSKSILPDFNTSPKVVYFN